MKNQSQWRIAAFGLFLALLTLLVWPPSTIAQQLRHTPAPANLGPTLNLLFVDIHPASSRSNNLSLIPGTGRGQPYAEVRFLPSGTGRLTHEPFAVPDSTEPANATHITSVQHAHQRAMRKAGLEPFAFYSWRHSFGTRCAESGMDKYALARLMGHSSPRVAERYYVHVTEPHVTAGFERFLDYHANRLVESFPAITERVQ